MPKAKTPRITAAEKEQRVNKVYELLISGARRYQILQYASSEKSGWNVEARMVDNYIADANAMIAAEAEFHRTRELGRAIAALDDLYQRCMKVQDYTRALAVRKELSTLLGLHAPPAAQTIKLAGVDFDEFVVLVDGLRQHDIEPSEIFQKMLNRLALEDQEKKHDAN